MILKNDKELKLKKIFASYKKYLSFHFFTMGEETLEGIFS